ncbi:Vomp family autotransporter [Bartonella sp. B12(2025)]
MKKLYLTPNLVKAVSLGTAMATLLSGVTPVFAANLAITGQLNLSTNGVNVAYSKGSHGSIVLSGDDDACGVDNVTGRGGSSKTGTEITAKEQYNRFINNQQFGAYTPYGTMTQQAVWTGDGTTSNNGGYMGVITTQGGTNFLPEAYGIYSFATGCGSYASGNYSTAFGSGATTKAGGAQAFGVSALASGKATVAMGVGSEASGEAAVAFGGLATASGQRSVALGSETEASADYTVAIGARAEAKNVGAIAIGGNTYAKTFHSVAIGINAQVLVNDGVAVGGGSVSNVDKDVPGYDPATGESSTNSSIAWKSTSGAFSVGEVDNGGTLTRQITGVAAGSADTDAVNVAQLKAMKDLVSGTWKLAVNDEAPTDVNAGSTVKFVAIEKTQQNNKKSQNLKISKDDQNTVSFDLADNITVKSVTAGNTLMNESGFGFTEGRGPKITMGGIDLRNKKITGVADGTRDNDAVNYKQLKDLKDSVRTSWQLSVNGEDATAVNPDSTVNLQVAGNEKKKNLKISKDDQNTVTFDLADNITVTSITTGRSIMSDDGFLFLDGQGPRMTLDGIDAGEAKITGVARGVADNDAVNVAQLKEVQNNIAGNGLVKWVEDRKLITIGNEKDGTKIDIAGSEGDRTITGVKAAVNGNEAVNKKQLDSIIADTSDSIKHNILVKQDGENAPITVGKERGGTTVNITNKSGEDRIISGVKAAVNDNDAVNKAQLDGHITDLTASIKSAKDFSVRYDKNRDNTVNYNSVTLGNDESKGPVALLNVKDGNIKENSTDAINGGQINKISQNIAEFFGGNAEFSGGVFTGPRYNLSTVGVDGKVAQREYNDVGSALTGLDSNIKNVNQNLINTMNDVASYFGGGAGYDNNGGWRAPTFTVSEINANGTTSKKNYDNVADAFGGINSSITDIYNQINNVAGDSLVKWIEEQKLITVGREKGGTKIDVAGSWGERIITGVADGKISNGSTEAINGSQLFTIADTISQYFGGDTDVYNDVGPDYVIQTDTYDNVFDAFDGVNNSITDIYNQINNIAGDSLVKWVEGQNLITVGKEKGGMKIDVAGSDGKRIIAGVAHGEISQDSTEAINGSQLYYMGGRIAAYFGGGASYENGNWVDPTFKIAQFNADGTTVEKKYNNVADALGGINDGISNINNRINDAINDAIEKADSDALKWNKGKGAYDASRDGQPKKIINVADGKIAKDSKDAVNGGQLWQTNERVADVEQQVNYIENRVDNISNTIGDIGDTVNDIRNTVNNISEDAVRYERDEDGKKTNKVVLEGGDAGEPVIIDNVADGRLETGSKEAVNGGQLHDYTQEQMKIVLDDAKHYTDQRVNNIVVDAIDDAVERANSYTNMKFETLTYDIQSVRKEARRAAAIGLAVSNLRYDNTPGKLSIAFGSGLWRSQSAFAFGAGYTSESGNIRSNVSVTSSGSSWGVGAGFSMTLN